MKNMVNHPDYENNNATMTCRRSTVCAQLIINKGYFLYSMCERYFDKKNSNNGL